MPRQVQIVKDMAFDEVSLVDRAACPPAAIVIAKSADPEVGMNEFLDEDGNPLDLSQFEEGTVLVDDEGNQYEVVLDDDTDEGAEDNAEELVAVGKSAFGADPIIAGIRDELSKAVSESDRDQVLSKAFTSLAKRAERAEAEVARATEIAKSERDLRLRREYIAKAAEYNVPVDPEVLGPVLMRATEALSFDDCAVIHKALSAAGELLFTEAGIDTRAATDDPMAEIDAFLEGEVAKSGGGVSKAAATTAFFDSNPEAYDAYRADRNR